MRAFWNKSEKTKSSDCSHMKICDDQTDDSVTPVKELSVGELCSKFDPDTLSFITTADVPYTNVTIGQERALRAIEFGLKIKSMGYNLFVTGIAGTGKDHAILQKVSQQAQSEVPPDDICYVYNFKSPKSPAVLYLPCGQGKMFKSDMENMIEDIRNQIKDAFCSESYERCCYRVENDLDNERMLLNRQLKMFAQSRNIDLNHYSTDKTVQTFSYERKELEFENFSIEKEDSSYSERQQIHEKIFDLKRSVRLKKKQMDAKIKETERIVIIEILQTAISQIAYRYKNNSDVFTYLAEVKEDLIKNIENLKQWSCNDEAGFLDCTFNQEKYNVNLFIDNSELDGAPVVIERNPSYANLFGSIEYRMQGNIVSADHLSLQPGSVHRARGGYLILEIEEILGDLAAWNALKKVLRYGVVRIENIIDHNSISNNIQIRPDQLHLNLKVILTGDPLFFTTLYNNDDEFVRVFKVKAEFVEHIKKTEQVVNSFISFIARICHEENLLHCDRNAVASIIDYSSRLIDQKGKISAQLVKVVDLLREANYYAVTNGCSCISQEHIKSASCQLQYRSSLLENKIHSLIEDSTFYLDTRGREIGQVNGVSIISTGDHSFGVPSRITAKTFIGPGNIINIEREAEMSGKIHAKGVLILSGYFGQTYAQDKPLALSASICFEQHYEEIDGDSASCAELFCLMSSLSGIPIRQDLAVTGSVDQRGMIQPVGGINTKIEGFFKACTIKGLTGTQGVIIPAANVKNLMLSDDVLTAVEMGNFHIYAVSTIEEGMEILTGRKAGKVTRDGSFQSDTIHFLVNQKLREYAFVMTSYEKDQSI